MFFDGNYTKQMIIKKVRFKVKITKKNLCSFFFIYQIKIILKTKMKTTISN